MKEVSNFLPKVAYVFGDFLFGGSNIQAVKTIIASGQRNNCVAICLCDRGEKSIESMLTSQDIKVIHLRLSKLQLVLNGPKELKKVLLLENCDIAHSNGLVSDMICSFATKNTKIKHVITLHNYLKEDALTRMSKTKAKIAVIIQRHVLKKSEHIIACSEVLKDQMLADYSSLKISAIENGIDTRIFCKKNNRDEIRAINGIPKNHLVFITTGSLTERKRITETIDAFVAAQITNAFLLIVGEGPLSNQLKNKYANNQYIRFMGLRPDVADLLNCADIFVSSSSSEGLPLGVLEAISTGRFVLLSDIPQHKEILHKIDFGKMYPLGDLLALSKLMRECAKSLPKTDVDLSNTDFDIEVMGKKYRAYYDSLVSI